MHLGRLPEAEAALSAALEKYPDDAELIANSVVLNVLAGKPSGDLEAYVLSTYPFCPIFSTVPGHWLIWCWGVVILFLWIVADEFVWQAFTTGAPGTWSSC